MTFAPDFDTVTEIIESRPRARSETESPRAEAKNADVLTILVENASPSEGAVLEVLAVKAGLMWKCDRWLPDPGDPEFGDECDQINRASDVRCTQCDATR